MEVSISQYIQTHQGFYRLPLFMVTSLQEALPPCSHPEPTAVWSCRLAGSWVPLSPLSWRLFSFFFLCLDLLSPSVLVFLPYFSRAHLPVDSWKKVPGLWVLSPYLHIWLLEEYKIAEWTPRAYRVSRAPPCFSCCCQESGSILISDPQ